MSGLSVLIVGDAASPFAWSFQVQAGGLAYEQRYFHLHEPEGATASDAGGMAVDANGYLYVASPLGIQVCDQAGRVVGIIRHPPSGRALDITFAGKGLNTIYATAGGKVWRRTLRRQGYLPWQPVKLPRPQL